VSRSPFVIGKSDSAFGRGQTMYDTTMGWRFVNKKLDAEYGTDVMPQTAENLAIEKSISREDQDKFALWSQEKAAAAQQDGRLAREITPVSVPRRKQDPLVVDTDEHPRSTSLEKLSGLRSLFPDGTVTAGNASGINDGAAALLLASAAGVAKHKLTPKARILGMAVAGVPPRIMGIGPVPATQKLLQRLKLSLDDFDVLELNEAWLARESSDWPTTIRGSIRAAVRLLWVTRSA
jgi:acetyl-CoA acetyltransferase family protein